MKPTLLPRLVFASTLASLLATPALLASEATARAKAEVSEVKGDAAKAALQEIDAEIDRLDVLVDSAPDMEERNAARARVDVLKERRAELRKTYVKARYDELKADVRAEANRLAAWTKRTFNRDEASEARREVNDTVSEARRDAREAGDAARRETREIASDARRATDGTYNVVTTDKDGMDLDLYKNRSGEFTEDEAKLAVKALDRNIEILDDRVDKMARGAGRDAAERRVELLEERKDRLESRFSKTEFDSLVNDVQAELKSLRTAVTE